MKREPEHTRNTQMNNKSLFEAVIHRPQRRSMSRYMIKKQVNNIDKIMNDPQIMDIE